MAKAKVNIPWPHQNLDNGYVAYNWPAGDGSYAGAFWERRRQAMIQALAQTEISYTDNIPELKHLGERVKSIGQAERQKELSFLKQNIPDFDFTDIKDKDLITKINELVNGEAQFRYALDRIKKAIALGRKKNKKNEDYKGLAPTMASVFMSYMTTALTARMRDLAKLFPPTQAVREWKQNLDQIFEESVDEAMRKMLEESEIRSDRDEAYGDATQWREIGEAYRGLSEFQHQFKNMLKQQLKLDELKSFFDTKERQTILKQTRRNKRKTGNFAKELGWKSQQLYNTIGGNVNEYIINLIEQNMPLGAHIQERQSTVIQGKIAKIDNASLYQYEAEVDVDLSKMFNQLNETISQSISLEDAARRFQEFYDRNLATLNKNNFFIVTNTKMASMGSGFAGFHNGKKQPLERLVDYIEMADISTDKAKDFINMAYNTLETAIFEDRQAEVEETIRNILTSAAARLLFDDWSTIGTENTGTQILNFFNLDGVIVPSSVFFINLGEAMIKTAETIGDENKMKTWFSVYVNLPKTVVYKNEPGRWEGLGETNEEIKKGIWEKWEEQAATARREASFETKFLFNFKSFIKGIM